MRILKDKVYVTETIPGISGFQRWNEREFHLVNADRARLHRIDVTGEYIASNTNDVFRIEDGHLPDHQPQVNEQQAIEIALQGNYIVFWKTVQL